MYLDINLSPLLTHQYEIESNITNIEIGGGLSRFSKVLYPQSYLTDITFPTGKPHFSEVNDLNTVCHFIDFECDILKFDFGGKLFDNIIMCNPYGYGFKHNLEGVLLLNKLGGILKSQGCITIVSNKRNPYTTKIEDLLRNDLHDKINFKFKIEKSDIDSQQEFNNMTFTSCDLKTATVPNERIVLKKTA